MVNTTGTGISLDSWVGLTLMYGVPPSCLAAQPVLPISHQPRQNEAEGGTTKIKVNPPQLSEQMLWPVDRIIATLAI